MVAKTLKKITHYLSLVKFAHTVFAMPFAFIGFTLAATDGRYVLRWELFILVLLCMIFARNAAMGFNRYADREIDKINPRTMLREIPAGIIRERSALMFTLLMSLLFICTTYFINRLCFYLSPVALFVILGYSFTKRFTVLAHLVLGLGLSLAPIGAYLAVPILFAISVMLWVGGFDIIYSLQDEQFDKDNNLKSIPAYLGIRKALLVSSICHILSVLFIVAAGMLHPFGWLYWIGCLIFTILIVIQHSLVKTNDISRVNMAFATVNGIASIVFALCVIGDLLYF